MADEQACTLAFLQNFYTDVTLYMPFEAHERAPVAEAQAPTPPALVPAAPPAAAAPVAAPAPTLPPPAASKLPSLAGLGTAPAPPASPVQLPVEAPLASPVVAAAPLVPPAAAPLASSPAPVAPYLLTTFSTLGSNAQGVVLLVRLPADKFMKLSRNVFLNKLLQAIGLVMADVVLVNVDGPYPVALANLRKEIAAKHILAFGKNLLDVAVRTTQIYEPVQFPAVDLAYLAGAEVELIEYDVSLKKRLWAGLQRMFLKA
jgi:hypothetical protein